MNWLPIKHTLFVNRTNAGTFRLRLEPDSINNKFLMRADSDSAAFEEALSRIENKVKAIRIARG